MPLKIDRDIDSWASQLDMEWSRRFCKCARRELMVIFVLQLKLCIGVGSAEAQTWVSKLCWRKLFVRVKQETIFFNVLSSVFKMPFSASSIRWQKCGTKYQLVLCTWIENYTSTLAYIITLSLSWASLRLGCRISKLRRSITIIIIPTPTQAFKLINAWNFDVIFFIAELPDPLLKLKLSFDLYLSNVYVLQ